MPYEKLGKLNVFISIVLWIISIAWRMNRLEYGDVNNVEWFVTTWFIDVFVCALILICVIIRERRHRQEFLRKCKKSPGLEH